MMSKRQMKDYMVKNFGFENPYTIKFFAYCEGKHTLPAANLFFQTCRLDAEQEMV